MLEAWYCSGSPSRRMPTRSLRLEAVHSVAASAVWVGEPVVSRAPAARAGGESRPTAAAVGAWSTLGKSAGGGPTGRRSPVRTGSGPRPDRVSVALRSREPAARLTPPRTETYVRSPTCGVPSVSDLAVGQSEGSAIADAATIDVSRGRSSSQRQHHIAAGAHRQAAQGDFERGCGVRLGQQPGAEAKRIPVGSPRAADADRRKADSPEVLHQERAVPWPAPPARDQCSSPAPDASTKRTTASGCNSAGGSRSMSKTTTSVRPISCQPPGEDSGIDGTELTRQGHSAGWHGRCAAPCAGARRAAGHPSSGMRSPARSHRTRPASQSRCGRR